MLAHDEGETALHRAVKLGDVDLTQLLLDYGADPTIRTKIGLDCFDYEKRHGPFPLVRDALLKSASG